MRRLRSRSPFVFFFNDTATTEIYTLSLHDALPIYLQGRRAGVHRQHIPGARVSGEDRKSTRLNSSHTLISYAVFCLTKKSDRRSTRLNSSHTLISHAVFCLTKKIFP